MRRDNSGSLSRLAKLRSGLIHTTVHGNDMIILKNDIGILKIPMNSVKGFVRYEWYFLQIGQDESLTNIFLEWKKPSDSALKTVSFLKVPDIDSEWRLRKIASKNSV